MEKKNWKEVTSSCRLSHYKARPGGGIPQFSYTAFNEDWGLMEKLFSYHEKLGVDGYDQDPNGVAWSIRNNWYTTDQIERMLALKAFI